MNLSPEKILQFIQNKTSHPMKIKELARAMKVSRRDYPGFRRLVKKLVADGRLVRLKRGRVGQAEKLDIAVGTISINRSGRGFLEVEGSDEDILIIDGDCLQRLTVTV